MKPLDWTQFDDVDLPEWMDEEQGNTISSFLNSYIPREYSTRGFRYHLLNRYPSRKLYFHLLRPTGGELELERGKAKMYAQWLNSYIQLMR